MNKPWNKRYKDDSWNEFYTTYEFCESYFTPFIKELKNNKICCPCDSSESNIVKWCKDNNLNVTYFNNLDFNSQEAHTIIDSCDLVLTNPPFESKICNPLVDYLISNNKKFIIVQSILYGHECNKIQQFNPLNKNHSNLFIKPDGSLKSVSVNLYLFNIDVPYLYPRSPKMIPEEPYENGFLIPCSQRCLYSIKEYNFKEVRLPGKFMRYYLTKK